MEIFRTTVHKQITGKKNSRVASFNRKTGKPFFRQSDKAKAQETILVQQFRKDFQNSGIDQEYWGGLRFQLEVRIYNKDLRRHDLDNQLSTIQDALVKAGVLPDDDQDTIYLAAIIYKGVDRANPRAEIKIIGG